MSNVLSLSLLVHCQKCGAKCCIPGETIGAPIVSGDELIVALRIPGVKVDQFMMVHVPAGKYYYVPKMSAAGRCIFLSPANQCIVQGAKFADCRIYPIKAVFNKIGEAFYVIDIHCPAAPYLTPEFIAVAKKDAMRSLAAWDPEVYQHWLDLYIQWTKDAWELEAYLELSQAEKLAFQVY